MNIIELCEQLEAIKKRPSFISCLYTTKNSGELANFTLRMGSNYVRQCEQDLVELQIRLSDAQSGIERVVIRDLMRSVQESIDCRKQGIEHSKFTKRGMYATIDNLPGIKLFKKDISLEICGFEHSRKVIVEGVRFPITHKSPESALRRQIRAQLRLGKYKTLCIDAGHIHQIRINGETLIFE